VKRTVGSHASRGDNEKHESGPHSPTPRVPSRLFDDRLQEATALVGRCRLIHDEAMMTITMLKVKVRREEPIELHEQVAAEIRRAIAEGEAKPGERLPPATDFAAVLHVNRNTVLRAFRQLRDEGLLEFQRGRGVTVAGTPSRGEVAVRARELVQFARRHGYSVKELVKIIESVP
jgi:GntR family transcriptional regulator